MLCNLTLNIQIIFSFFMNRGYYSMKDQNKDDYIDTSLLEFDKKNFINPQLMEKLVKSKVRLKIFLALYIYPKLFVSELSRILNMDKTTVSRHLNKMESDGLLESYEEETKRRLKRKYFQLSSKYEFDIEEYRRYLDKNEIKKFLMKDKKIIINKKKQLIFIKRIFAIIRALITLVLKGFELYTPMIDKLEEEVTDFKSATKFLKYFIPEQKMDFYPIIISEERLKEANKLFENYSQKLLELQKKGESKGEQKSILILHTILPLKDILEDFNK